MIKECVELIKNKRTKRFLTIVVVVICGVMIWLLNKYTPMFGDDYNYSFIMGVYPWTRMTSITQLPLSMYNHFYIAKCGKIFTNGLAQAFLLLPANVFDVINTIGFLVMILLVAYHITGNIKKISLKLFVSIFMLLILTTPSFGQSFLWIDGASNYLYGPMLVLLFLLPYRKKYAKESHCKGMILEIVEAIIMLVLGVLAGWTTENMSVALTVIIIGFIVTYKVNSQKINVWNITGLIGAIIGICFLLFGPGEQERIAESGGIGGIGAWVKRFLFISFNLFEYLQILLFLIALVVGYMYIKKQTIFKPLILVYAMGTLAAVYSMIASPIFPDRTWSGPLFLMIILFGLLVKNVTVEEEWLSKVAGCIFALGIVVTLGVYSNGYFAAKNAYAKHESRISIIEEAKAEGVTSVEVPIINGNSRFVPYQYYGDIEQDPDFWLNHSIAEYYELNEVIGR